MSSGEASVRFGNCCPDGSAVGVFVDGEATFRGVSFRTITDYESVEAGPSRLRLVEERGEDPLLDASFDLSGGEHATALAVGTTAGLRPLVLSDRHDPVPDGRTLVRFVHAIPDAPVVDVDIPDGPTLFEDVAFGEFGGYAPVEAGTHHVAVRTTDGDTLLPLPRREFPDGEAVTLVAVGRTVDDSLGAIVRRDAATAVEVDE